ncbi:hypothetical protein AB6A23_13120 [Paenibacillus tarimensis]
MKVWRDRLRRQLAQLSSELKWKGEVDLDLSWGPFYNGFVLMDDKRRKAKIVVQLPYDGYLTADERNILIKYPISRRELPYFILFHEFSHLIDAIRLAEKTEWIQIIRGHQKLAAITEQSETAYRNLPFERYADEFAYRRITNMHKQAG